MNNWPNLYRLAEEPQVNISKLTVRLRRLVLLNLRDRDTIYYSEK